MTYNVLHCDGRLVSELEEIVIGVVLLNITTSQSVVRCQRVEGEGGVSCDLSV